MTRVRPENPTPAHLTRSLAAVIVGSLLLRAAAGAMGENIQFYFNAIHEAALSPTHPLRLVSQPTSTRSPIPWAASSSAPFLPPSSSARPLFGAWSDRYGRKLFIIFGPLFGALAVRITAMTTLVWLLIFTRLFEGLSTASNAPATLGYIAEASAGSPDCAPAWSGCMRSPPSAGSRLASRWAASLAPFWDRGLVAGIPLTSPAFAINVPDLPGQPGGPLVRHERRAPFNRRAPARARSKARETLRHYWKIARSPRVASFAPAWIAVNAVLGIWINLSARMLTDKNGFPHQLLVGKFDSFQAGNIVAAYALVFVLGIPLWTVLFFACQTLQSDADRRRWAARLVPDDFALNHQPALSAPLVLPLAGLLVVTIMVQSGFTPAALAHLADITEEHAADRGAIMGLYSVFLGLGQFLGASIGGPFVDWMGADGMVLITTLFGLIAGVLLLRLFAHEARLPALPEHALAAEELLVVPETLGRD